MKLNHLQEMARRNPFVDTARAKTAANQNPSSPIEKMLPADDPKRVEIANKTTVEVGYEVWEAIEEIQKVVRYLKDLSSNLHDVAQLIHGKDGKARMARKLHIRMKSTLDKIKNLDG